MKLLKIAWLFAIAFTLIFASCKKENEETLPPATQIGAGTFGCKINGKVYVPKGSSGTGAPNPKVQYDLDLNGQPYLLINTSRYNGDKYLGEIFIIFKNLNSERNFSYPSDLEVSCGSPEIVPGCATIAFDTTIKKFGNGQITRLDITNRIISGTFYFKYKTVQCDTVFVNDGRFDIKF